MYIPYNKSVPPPNSESILVAHDFKRDENDRKTSKTENAQAKWRLWKERVPFVFLPKWRNIYKNISNVSAETSIYNKWKTERQAFLIEAVC